MPMSWQDNLDSSNCKFACPHLGGMALSLLQVSCNSYQDEAAKWRHEVERLRNELAKRDQRMKELTTENEQLRRELKAIHRRPFQKHCRKDDATTEETGEGHSALTEPTGTEKTRKKRGAPVGHPGWCRRPPLEWDRSVDAIPQACPTCGGAVEIDWHQPVYQHIQEDLAENGGVEVVCYRHPKARCPFCRAAVQVAGAGELLGCPIGPNAKAAATVLHWSIGLSCRKVQRVFAELLHLKFSPAAVLGFDAQASQQAQPLADDIKAKVRYAAVIYADESYWTVAAAGAYVWFHGNEHLAYFQIDTSRAGDISRQIVGENFDGALVTDCYSGYEKHSTKVKQKCLAHLRRTAKEWLELVPADSRSVDFFGAVVEWVRRACALHRARPRSEKWTVAQAEEIHWLGQELKRLQTTKVDHERAERLQKRIQKYRRQWLTFIDHPEVEPTNNLAERSLRPLVILRKLTFGNRSPEGAHRAGVLFSVLETAKRQGHGLLKFCQQLFQQSDRSMLRLLYSPSG